MAGRPRKYTENDVKAARGKFFLFADLEKEDKGLAMFAYRQGLREKYWPKVKIHKVCVSKTGKRDCWGKPCHDRSMAQFIYRQQIKGVPVWISNEDWLDFLSKDVCDCCGHDVAGFLDKSAKTKVFDHCHVTGRYRGTLCNQCNSADGMLGGLEGAKNLVKYLTK